MNTPIQTQSNAFVFSTRNTKYINSVFSVVSSWILDWISFIFFYNFEQAYTVSVYAAYELEDYIRIFIYLFAYKLLKYIST